MVVVVRYLFPDDIKHFRDDPTGAPLVSHWRPTGVPQWLRKSQLTKAGDTVAQSSAGISKSPGNVGGWYILGP